MPDFAGMGELSYITLAAGDHSGINVGVTFDSWDEDMWGAVYNTTGKFTTNGAEEDLACLTSDIADYTVKYNVGGYLELVSTDEISEDVSGAKYSASLTLNENNERNV